MNILPALSLASAAKDFLAALFPGAQETPASSDTQHAAGFYQFFRQASDSPGLQEFDALLAAEHDDATNNGTPSFIPLEKAPAVLHSVNSTHYQLGEVGFTQHELGKLRDNLLREGLTPRSLTVIEQLAAHPHGATLGQLLALMHGSVFQPASLSDDDKKLLLSFADKIDTSGTLGKSMLHLLEHGRVKEAWDALKSALAAINPQDQLVIEAGEAALLCKAFGISQGASLEILRNFGHAGAMPLTPDIFTALMMPAQQEILDKFQQDDKLRQALAKHLQPIIDEARRREELARKAAEGADRKSRHTELLIRDRIMDSFREDVATPETDGTRLNPLLGKREDAARKEGQPGTSEEAKTLLKPEDAAAVQDRNKAALAAKAPDEAHAPKKPAQDLLAEADGLQSSPQRPRGEQQGGSGQGQQDARRDSQALLSRLEVRHNAQISDTLSSFAMPEQPQEQVAGQTSNPATLVRYALQQVEQGTLSRLANGGQRLELQLAPSEMGAVTLILTSGKGGEISATIRSERSETAELVARHLDIIRVNLEEQGLKVDKLEVRSHTQDNRDDWQGMEQHNAMREEQERREHLERLRRLGRQSGNEAQARDVHTHEHTAETSGQGLYLVA